MMVRERGVISAPTTPTKKEKLEADVASVLLKSARNIASEQKEKNEKKFQVQVETIGGEKVTSLVMTKSEYEAWMKENFNKPKHLDVPK